MKPAPEVTRTIQSMEKASLANVLTLVHDGISTRYLAMLSDKVSQVVMQRNRLRSTALCLRAVWRDLDGLDAPPEASDVFMGKRRTVHGAAGLCRTGRRPAAL